MQIPPSEPTEQPQWTILKLLRWTEEYFRSRNVEGPRSGAQILLAHLLELERIDLYLRHDQPLNPDELSRFKAMIRRRVKGEPVAYITGRKGFWSLDLAVSPDVLIPRPETEILVETALGLLKEIPRARVLDMGTGSGAIICAIGAERPGDLLFASDRSEAALRVARKNALSRLRGKREEETPESMPHFFAGEWLLPVRGDVRFHLILSNPPYIPTRTLEGLQPEIHHEPKVALDGGEDGLDPIRRIIARAGEHLHEEGSLLMEIGHDQWEAVEELLRETGEYREIRPVADYGGHQRVAVATR